MTIEELDRLLTEHTDFRLFWRGDTWTAAEWTVAGAFHNRAPNLAIFAVVLPIDGLTMWAQMLSTREHLGGSRVIDRTNVEGPVYGGSDPDDIIEWASKVQRAHATTERPHQAKLIW